MLLEIINVASILLEVFFFLAIYMYVLVFMFFVVWRVSGVDNLNRLQYSWQTLCEEPAPKLPIYVLCRRLFSADIWLSCNKLF